MYVMGCFVIFFYVWLCLEGNSNFIYEKATLFIRSGLPSTLSEKTVHRKRNFSKTHSSVDKFETPASVLVWTENILKTELFENVFRVDELENSG